MVSVMPLAISAVVALLSLFTMKQRVNIFFMRFFRDLSRYKSRKRLYGNQAALMPILMGTEEPVEINTDIAAGGEDYTMTAAQLADMDGRTAETPIYISIDGLIYDVSAARKMYGPGGNYHYFAGTDGTQAYATGCTSKACLKTAHPLEKLTPDEHDQIKRWVELYHHHDKYKFIGKLVVDPVDQVLNADPNNSKH
jgi:predicted heme/steroid binding protein